LQAVEHAAEQLGSIAEALEGMLAQRQALASRFDAVMSATTRSAGWRSRTSSWPGRLA
jgi:hypothetical protein